MKTFFGEIRKVDEEQRMVWGYASTEALDSHGEIVTKGAIKDAWDDYMKFANVREMHQPSAVGIVKEFNFDDSGVEIGVHVVDDAAWAKVVAKVYRGFSIGGKKLPGGYDTVTKTISKMKLTEISLVDRPANPESMISMWKSEDAASDDIVASVPPEAAAAVDELAEILNKGDITPARLVELAQAELIAKAAPAPAPVEAEPIAKGMYDVSRFAELLQSVGCMASNAEWEAEYEKDGSKVPAQLRDWLKAGTVVFAAMAAEEVAEFVAQYAPAAAAEVTVIELADAAGDLRKSLTDAAALSMVDYLTIAKAHMPEADVAKAVVTDGFDKATDAIVAMLNPSIAKLDAANATIAKMQTENDDLVRKVAALEAMPAAGGPALRIVVEKGQDIADPKPEAKSEPIKKADGTIDQEATALQEIKKVQSSGGQSLRFINKV